MNQARFIDQRGLSQLTRADFQRMARDLQRRLPDTLIERALHRLPPAVYALEGPDLGQRPAGPPRKPCPRPPKPFTCSLAREPALGGTAQAERFVVRRYPDSTTVRVFSAVLGPPARQRFAAVPAHLFRRRNPQLNLAGLGGNDVFERRPLAARAARCACTSTAAGRHRPPAAAGSARRLETPRPAHRPGGSGAPRPVPPGSHHRAYNRLNDD